MPSERRNGLPEGLQERHKGSCPAAADSAARCRCRRSYRASIYDSRTKKHTYSGWKADRGAVEKWRVQALRELDAELRAGTLPAGSTPLLSETWEAWYAGAQSGAISNRKGERYKARALESYAAAWRKVEPTFGHKRIGAITRREVQDWVDELAKKGTPRSTVANALEPLRVLLGRAERRSEITANPTTNLELPASANSEMRFATKDETGAFIEALPTDQKALWATAFYGGLRRGELQALRWTDVDLGAAPAITVQRAFSGDDEGKPKSSAGVRRVPVVPPLAKLLKAHKASTGRSGSDLVFGRTASQPFVPSTVRANALKAWKDSPLEPIGLHQARHTAASFMIAAGANAKALSVVMGHASIEITFNRYGHLMPGSEDEVGQRLAAYLDASNVSAVPISVPTGA